MVAIVGRSGSGKTTMAKCLAGLLEPTGGTILFDGLDLKSLNYRDLRRQIGFVLQDSYVFADTIGRNIAFGEDEPDMARVAWAAEAASAVEFIERLPFGYDTRIGETGVALSGGQKQRIAIARALYTSRRFWCSTKRRVRSTPNRSERSSRILTRCCAGGPRL